MPNFGFSVYRIIINSANKKYDLFLNWALFSNWADGFFLHLNFLIQIRSMYSLENFREIGRRIKNSTNPTKLFSAVKIQYSFYKFI